MSLPERRPVRKLELERNFADTYPAVDDPTWTFARGADELMLVRRIDSEGVSLSLTLNSSAPRTYTFRDVAAAMRCQSRMEASFLKFGWSFVGYMPQRRIHDERRAVSRPTDRRRWWTDGSLFGLL